jgi:2-polyprenyl-3-methyl-5-hydroxy-6-metoxy-1,4-benzoquinol methylase
MTNTVIARSVRAGRGDQAIFFFNRLLDDFPQVCYKELPRNSLCDVSRGTLGEVGMSDTPGPSQDDVRKVWNTNADFWDDKIGDGNDFQIELIEPATERLLGNIAGLTILDVACGAGRFGRRMAQLGANVLAVDFCDRFLERAKKRTPAGLRNIEYRAADATNKEQLLALGAGRFDGAVCTMALMDMTTIDPLMESLPVLLKPNGWFIFSIMHPCFQPANVTKFAESIESDGNWVITTGVKVSEYLTPKTWRGIGILGQPEPQHYFHRPLNVIFNAAFRNGFVIDGFEEPGFREPPQDDRYLRWRHLTEIPPVLVVRMRLCRREMR